ncbi:MAG: cytochrome c [Maricaulaceae bacterium]|jgi:mono/diheme cytochrome c family protein
MIRSLTYLAAVLAATGCNSIRVDDGPIAVRADASPYDGFQLYEFRCKGCHEPAAPGAPSRAELAAMSPDDIVAALVDGDMALLTLDMPRADAFKIAEYLTSQAAPTAP